jgi:hypothetical protein
LTSSARPGNGLVTHATLVRSSASAPPRARKLRMLSMPSARQVCPAITQLADCIVAAHVAAQCCRANSFATALMRGCNLSYETTSHVWHVLQSALLRQSAPWTRNAASQRVLIQCATRLPALTRSVRPGPGLVTYATLVRSSASAPLHVLRRRALSMLSAQQVCCHTTSP